MAISLAIVFVLSDGFAIAIANVIGVAISLAIVFVLSDGFSIAIGIAHFGSYSFSNLNFHLYFNFHAIGIAHSCNYSTNILANVLGVAIVLTNVFILADGFSIAIGIAIGIAHFGSYSFRNLNFHLYFNYLAVTRMTDTCHINPVSIPYQSRYISNAGELAGALL